jgi:hypothetical protein
MTIILCGHYRLLVFVLFSEEFQYKMYDFILEV